MISPQLSYIAVKIVNLWKAYISVPPNIKVLYISLIVIIDIILTRHKVCIYDAGGKLKIIWGFCSSLMVST